MTEADVGQVVPSRIPSTGEHHEPWALTAAQRAVYRERSKASRAARAAALAGQGPEPLHPVNAPVLDPMDLMPEARPMGLRALSLFSGGGGLDLGFRQAGYEHVASYELLEDAAATLQKANPDWLVYGGEEGDVTRERWSRWRRKVDVLHGGPPCQPFSNGGRRRGSSDSRDMWPAFVEAVRRIDPPAFVAENVPGLATSRFRRYVQDTILGPLSERYTVRMLLLRAESFGVPQVRRRVVFVGFRSARTDRRYEPPQPSHDWRPAADSGELQRCLGLREALGLPDIGYDALAPTIRSTLTGPRHTTSILSSVSAKRAFERLAIWPNGVAPSREQARAFVSPNGHFRLSIQDVALMQGFPEDWPFVGATYMALGQIGNAVPPPLGYAVASSVAAALRSI